MGAANLNLYLEQGAGFSKTFDFATDGEPDDLTGVTFKAHIRSGYGGVLIGALTPTIKDQSTDRGTMVLSMDSAVVQKLPTRPSPLGDLVTTTYVWDLIKTPASGEPERVFFGEVYLSPGV